MAVNSIDTQGVTVTIDAAPLGVPAGTPTAVDCLIALGNYKQTRAKKEYKCMSSNESTVGLGSISRDPLTLELLYNEASADGQAKLSAAFNNNEPVQISIEFDNSGGVNGTTVEALVGIAELDLNFPKDGKIEAKFSVEFQGAATITAAA